MEKLFIYFTFQLPAVTTSRMKVLRTPWAAIFPWWWPFWTHDIWHGLRWHVPMKLSNFGIDIVFLKALHRNDLLFNLWWKFMITTIINEECECSSYFNARSDGIQSFLLPVFPKTISILVISSFSFVGSVLVWGVYSYIINESRIYISKPKKVRTFTVNILKPVRMDDIGWL